MNYIKKYIPEDICKYVISEYLMPSTELVRFRKSINLHELKDWINICHTYIFNVDYMANAEYLITPRHNYMYNLPRWRSYISRLSEPESIELKQLEYKYATALERTPAP